jgi:rare lipoprotein A
LNIRTKKVISYLIILCSAYSTIGCCFCGKPKVEDWDGKRHYKGYASWYGKEYHGKMTSNGEIYNMYDLTAAHRSLPFNSLVEVKNLENGKKVVVRINDRGPFVRGRIIDLSYAAAQKLGIIGPGTAKVSLKVIKVGDKN